MCQGVTPSFFNMRKASGSGLWSLAARFWLFEIRNTERATRIS
jgi:hypothetical protein